MLDRISESRILVRGVFVDHEPEGIDLNNHSTNLIVKDSLARIDPVEAAIGLPTATAERGAVARYL